MAKTRLISMRSGKTYTFLFTVEGRGAFPIDMLRFDGCCPDSQIDVGNMDWQSGPQTRRVSLCRFTPNRKWEPTEARWNSFGWEVVEV